MKSFLTKKRKTGLLSRFRRMVAIGVMSVMCGMLLAPALHADRYGRYYHGGNNWEWDDRGEMSRGGESGRSIGGSVGLAAGFLGGAALAAAVTSAGAVAAMGPLAVMVIGASITVGGGFLGAKLFSHGGQWLTEKLGKQNMWMMIGATAGTIAAIALIPALGPFAGAGGLVVKGLVGGLAGGIIGRLFANQLEALATPRMLMTGVGAVVGGLFGNVPGAIAGAAGGYALGAIFDDHFFAKPGDSFRNYLPDLGGLTDKLRRAKDNVSDWVDGKMHDAGHAWNDNWYGNDPYYQYGYQYAQGPGSYYDSPFTYGYDPGAYDYRGGNVVDSYHQYRQDYGSFQAGMHSGNLSHDQMRHLYEQQGRSYQGYYGGR